MTDRTPGQDASSAVHSITPKAKDRLAQLHEAYADAKAHADEAEKRLKVITDGIKAELAALSPEDARRIQLMPRQGSSAPAMSLSWVTGHRLDSTRLKKEDPVTWVRYAKETGAWRLSALKPEGDES